MQKCLLMLLPLLANTVHAEVVERSTAYQKGSVIDTGLEVQDLTGQKILLRELITRNGKDLSVIYIFGGGAMGSEKSAGGIWCPDSFEDLHILRSLVSSYQGEVNFIPIAIPAAFHTRQFGFVERAFFDYSSESPEYTSAEQAYIDSTQDAFKKKIIPVQPYYDPRFRLLMSAELQSNLPREYGQVFSWQGAFRAENESQRYGVPHFWLVNKEGRVLTEPFRGNVYHPHGTPVNINYTLQDLAGEIDRLIK